MSQATRSQIDPLNRNNYTAITTMLTVKDVGRAYEFYQKAFGFEGRGIMAGPDGKPMHAELKLRDSVLMLGPATLRSRSISMRKTSTRWPSRPPMRVPRCCSHPPTCSGVTAQPCFPIPKETSGCWLPTNQNPLLNRCKPR